MEYKYKAFISYRHWGRDAVAAKAVQEMIERYVLPHGISDGGKRLGKVFRDESELSVSHDLPETIHCALDQSEFLILICSDRAAESQWVPREIAYFLAHHGPEKILPVFVGGDPEQVLATLLPMLSEPYYVDLSEGNEKQMLRQLRSRFPRLCAPLAGCDYDDLIMRDQKRRRARVLTATAVFVSLAAIVIGVLLWSYLRVEEKNQELARQNQEILLRESNILVLEAKKYLSEGDLVTAARYARDALPGQGEERPYVPQAEQVLFDAMDLFSGVTLSKKTTTLETNTPVEQMCFSKDGSLLVIVDEYGLVNCFDTVTGERCWTVTPIKDYSPGYRIFLMDPGDRVLVVSDSAVVALDLRSGACLWSTTYIPSFGEGDIDSVELSADGEFLIIFREVSMEGLDLVMISTKDGAVLDTVPVVSRGTGKIYYFYDSDCFAISSDGTCYAGAFYASSDSGYCIYCFVLELDSKEIRWIYSDEDQDERRVLYGLAFTDQDTTLTVVSKPDNPSILADVQKYRVSDGALIWSGDTGEEKGLFFYAGSGMKIVFQPGYILIGYEERLYAIHLETGELLCDKIMDEPVAFLESIQDDMYVFFLEDGTYNIGWINSNGLFYYDWTIPPLQLGALQGGSLYGGGYLVVETDETSITGLRAGTADEGFGHVAVIRPGGRQVDVVRAMDFIPELKQREILRYESSDYVTLEEVRIVNENTLALILELDYDQLRVVLIDRGTQQIIDQYDLLPDLSLWKIQLSPDGREYVYYDYSSGFQLFDRYGNGTVIAGDMPADFEVGDNLRYTNAVFHSKNLGRLNSNGEVLIACQTQYGLKLWCGENALPDVPYPDQFVEESYAEELLVGGNGYILLDFADTYADGPAQGYLLYSVTDQRWTEIAANERELEEHLAALGETAPWFAVIDQLGHIRIFDSSDGRQVLEVDTEFSCKYVETFKWVLDDRYLAVSTQDGYLMLIDPITGDVTRWDDLFDYGSELHFRMDADEERIYLWSYSEGVCLDRETLTRIAFVPRMDYYDPVGNVMFFSETIYGDTTDTLVVHTMVMPDMEELVLMAKEFLDE